MQGIDLVTFQSEIQQAKQAILGNPNIDHVIFAIQLTTNSADDTNNAQNGMQEQLQQQQQNGMSLKLRPVGGGPGGLAALRRMLSMTDMSFILVRVMDGLSQAFKIVLIGWIGEQASPLQLKVFQLSLPTIRQVFMGYHAEILARSLQDLDMAHIMRKLHEQALLNAQNTQQGQQLNINNNRDSIPSRPVSQQSSRPTISAQSSLHYPQSPSKQLAQKTMLQRQLSAASQPQSSAQSHSLNLPGSYLPSDHDRVRAASSDQVSRKSSLGTSQQQQQQQQQQQFVLTPTETESGRDGLSQQQQQQMESNQVQQKPQVAQNVLLRPLSTFGGYDVDKMLAAIRGGGECNSKRPFIIKDDLGKVDVFRLVMMLNADSAIDQYEAIRILLYLSYDPYSGLTFGSYQTLYSSLLSVLQRSLDYYQSPGFLNNNSDDEFKFWTYMELFEIDYQKSIVKFRLSHQSPDIAQFERFKYIGLSTIVIISNLLQNPVNADYIAQSTAIADIFLSICMCCLRLSPFIESHPVDSQQNEIDVNLADVVLQFRKEILKILTAIGHRIEIHSWEQLHLLLQIGLDFLVPCDNEFIGRAHNLSSNSCLGQAAFGPYSDDTKSPYHAQALEFLCKLTAVASNIQMIADILSVDDDNPSSSHHLLVYKLVDILVNMIPAGSFGHGGLGKYKDLIVMPVDILTVLATLQTLSHLCQVPAVISHLLTKCPLLLTLLSRMTTGIVWTHSPTFLDDDESLIQSKLYMGYRNNLEFTPTDRELVMNLTKRTAIIAGEILLEIVKSEPFHSRRRHLKSGSSFTIDDGVDECYGVSLDHHPEFQRSEYISQVLVSAQDVEVVGIDDRYEFIDNCGLDIACIDMEQSFLQLLLSPRIPSELQKLMSQVLLHLCPQSHCQSATNSDLELDVLSGLRKSMSRDLQPVYVDRGHDVRASLEQSSTLTINGQQN
ncbi:hypothetical protein MP228_000564 [Amoeboaphelidium protococcarum]|nr:hypothetical protein MP228_000564 [Amoeboaphelidium protococcarum]